MLEQLQEERGSIYGSYAKHAESVEQIIVVLKSVNFHKNGSIIFPDGFETTLFYTVSKLVRLAATPDHLDSAIDLASYADLYAKHFLQSKKHD